MSDGSPQIPEHLVRRPPRPQALPGLGPPGCLLCSREGARFPLPAFHPFPPPHLPVGIDFIFHTVRGRARTQTWLCPPEAVSSTTLLSY